MASIPFLSVNYFVGELQIPNLTGSAPAVTPRVNELLWFIKKYEPEFLELLLGEDLYLEFSAGIAATTPEAKWTTLKNKIYQIDSVNGIYMSPAAAYVYYHFMRNSQTATTSVGEIKPGKHAAVNVTNTMKMVSAWDDMCAECMEIWEWLEEDAQMAVYVDTDGEALFDPYQDNPFEPEIVSGKNYHMNMWNL